MEVWLVVQGDDGSLHDVAARIPGEGSAAQLAQALASELGLADPPPGQAWGLYSHRLESWLAPGTLASTLDVHHGDTVALTLVPATGGLPWAATGPVASALVEVRVTAGADIGRSWRLGAEEHVVGRADDAEIRLEDPFLAPAHARLSVAVDRVVVRDLGGPGGTRLDGDEVQDSRVVRPGSTITVGGSSLVLTRLSEPSAALGGGATEVSFNRQPRVIQPSSDYVHRLAAPPAEVRKPRLPLLTALLPLLLGGVMLLFTHSLLTLVFIVLSPVLAIGSYVESRLGGRGDFRRARAEFEDQLGAVEADLQSGTSEEVRRRNAEAPQLRHLALMAHRRDPTLWERRPQDDDFLALRLGLADQPSRHRVEFGDGGSSHLRQQAQVRLQPFGSVAGVPVVVPLSDRAVVGLAGPRSAVLDLARWLALQACCLHSPRNLAICAALPPEEAAAWDWLKWLPHTAPSARQVEGPALCSDNTGGRDLVERLVGLLDARAAEVGPFRGSSARSPYPYVLALLHEDLPLGRGSLTRLLAEGPRVGILVMWVGSAVRDLPNECRAVVEVDADAGVRLTYPEDGRHQAADGR